MHAFSITRKTKDLLRNMVSSGTGVDLWYFAVVRTDRAFQKELLALAKQHHNEAFLASLDEFLAQERAKFIAHQAARQEVEHRSAKRTKTKRFKRSRNYNPTGQSFEEFLQKRGIYINPNYRLRFVRGGAPGLGKRA